MKQCEDKQHAKFNILKSCAILRYTGTCILDWQWSQEPVLRAEGSYVTMLYLFTTDVKTQPWKLRGKLWEELLSKVAEVRPCRLFTKLLGKQVMYLLNF